MTTIYCFGANFSSSNEENPKIKTLWRHTPVVVRAKNFPHKLHWAMKIYVALSVFQQKNWTNENYDCILLCVRLGCELCLSLFPSRDGSLYLVCARPTLQLTFELSVIFSPFRRVPLCVCVCVCNPWIPWAEIWIEYLLLLSKTSNEKRNERKHMQMANGWMASSATAAAIPSVSIYLV